MKRCKYCGAENPDSQERCLSCGSQSFLNICGNCGCSFEGQYCSNCGVRAGKKKKLCPQCGTEYYTRACPECGYIPMQAQSRQTSFQNERQEESTVTRIEYVPVPAGKKCDKWTAFFLCLFFGVFGAHKFYEGRIGLGILYLLSLGLFGFGYLIDMVVLLLKPNPYYV